MRRCTANRFGWAQAVLFLAISMTQSSASGQKSNPFFGEQGNAIRQVSLSEEPDPLAESDGIDGDGSVSTPQTQLTVSIRYLMVDDETRRAIYDELDPQTIKHSAYAPPEFSRDDLSLFSSLSQVEKTVTLHGRSATCIVEPKVADILIQLVDEAPGCMISQAPSVILQQNQTAEINDIVQRPMVVDVQKELGQIKPVINVVDEGIRLRLLARLVPQGPAEGMIEVTTEFVNQQIMEVKLIEVLGLQEQPTMLQHAVCSTTQVMVKERLGQQQHLLIDPHIKKSGTIEVESTSVLGRLPLVGKSFISTESVSVQQHLIVLVKPALL